MSSHNVLQMPPMLQPAHFVEDDVVLRLLAPDDIIPDEFKTGIKQYDYHWVWAAVRRGVASALVVAAPYHDAVFFGGIFARPNRGILLATLLRKAVSDIYARGYQGYFTFCGDSEVERQIMRILKRAGAIVMDDKLVAVGGSVAVLRRW